MNVFLKNTFNIIKKDNMIMLLLISPILMAIALKYVSLYFTDILFNSFAFDLTQYYIYIDGFIFFLSGLLYAMVIAFIIIDETDDGVVSYYNITPIGGRKYLYSRLLIPTLILLLIFIVISIFFTLINHNIIFLLCIYIFSLSQMYLITMIIIALANNKLEALVIAKMLGLYILPYIIAMFEKSNYRFLLLIFPSLFLGVAIELKNLYLSTVIIIVGTIISFIYILILKKYFIKKLFFA